MTRFSNKAKEHLRVSPATGKVELIQPRAFELEMGEIKRKFFTKQIEELEIRDRTKSNYTNKSKAQAIQRMSSLWTPFGRRICLAGFRCVGSDGLVWIARLPSEKLEALRATWAPVFDFQAISRDEAKTFLLEHAQIFDFSGCEPPTWETYKYVIDNASNSATGLDGLPYEAWRQAGDSADCSYHHPPYWKRTHGRSARSLWIQLFGIGQQSQGGKRT